MLSQKGRFRSLELCVGSSFAATLKAVPRELRRSPRLHAARAIPIGIPLFGKSQTWTRIGE